MFVKSEAEQQYSEAMSLQTAVEVMKAPVTSASRPNSLALTNNNRPNIQCNTISSFAGAKANSRDQYKTLLETPTFMKTSNEVAGVTITTPSSGIPFNFDSLMDGGTGLTPVSGPLGPSCSTQQQRSHLSAVDLTSPDANYPSKLVSL